MTINDRDIRRFLFLTRRNMNEKKNRDERNVTKQLIWESSTVSQKQESRAMLPYSSESLSDGEKSCLLDLK